MGSNKNNKKKRVELYFERYLLVSRMEKEKIELLGVGGERKNNKGKGNILYKWKKWKWKILVKKKKKKKKKKKRKKSWDRVRRADGLRFSQQRF